MRLGLTLQLNGLSKPVGFKNFFCHLGYKFQKIATCDSCSIVVQSPLITMIYAYKRVGWVRCAPLRCLSRSTQLVDEKM